MLKGAWWAAWSNLGVVIYKFLRIGTCFMLIKIEERRISRPLSVVASSGSVGPILSPSTIL